MEPVGRRRSVEPRHVRITPQIVLGPFQLWALYPAAGVGGHQSLVHRVLTGPLEVGQHQLNGTRLWLTCFQAVCRSAATVNSLGPLPD